MAMSVCRTVLRIVGVLACATIARPVFAAAPCASLNSPDAVLECARSQGAEVRIQTEEVAAAEAGLAVAGQWLNPAVELEAQRDLAGSWTTGGKILFPIRIGGKASALSAIAQSEADGARNRLEAAREGSAFSVVSGLYRLRQISDELALARENAETFQSVRGAYQNAGRLGPENSVSLSVFRIALEEAKLRITQLESERLDVRSQVENEIGMALPGDLARVLPPLKKQWKPLGAGAVVGSEKRAFAVDFARAESELDRERSLRWPDLAIGPSYEVSSGPDRERKVGIAIELPLPLFSLNGGGVSQARAKVQRAQMSRSIGEERLAREVAALRTTYESAARSVTDAVRSTQLEDRHREVHRLVSRGVVSAALVIELHRQIYEYREALHAQELKGVQALWRIYALEGRATKESLQ